MTWTPFDRPFGAARLDGSGYLPTTRLNLPSLASALSSGGGTPIMQGVYGGNDLDAFYGFEGMTGRPMDLTHVFTDGQSDWGQIANPVYFTDRFRALNRAALWSVPMLTLTGSTLADIAGGARDAEFSQAAGVYATYQPKAPGGVQYVRLGWEMNITGFPWQIGLSGNTAANYIAVFRRIVGLFRAVSGEFRFVWCPNSGNSPPDPATLYPGDDVVDVVGQDAYQNSQYGLGEFAGQLVNNGRGINWGYDFAHCLNGVRTGQAKAYAIPEWGVAGNDADASGAQYVRDFKKWLAGADRNGQPRQVLFHSYWDGGTDTAYNGKLEAGGKPLTAAAYRVAFGGANLVATAA